MSEVAVTTLMPHAWPNIDNPKVADDAYFIRDHELKDALNKGFVRMWAEGDAVPAATGYREMPLVVIDNFDGDQANGSNGWVRFEGEFLAGDLVTIAGIKWMPVDPAVPDGAMESVAWGFEHICAGGDAIATAAEIAPLFVSQEGINGEAVENRIRAFSSLAADGGTSPGFSMHRANFTLPTVLTTDPETGEVTTSPLFYRPSGSFQQAGHPDNPNVENQYEGVYPEAPVPPPLGTGGGTTAPPVSPHGQKIGLDLDGDGAVDATYTKD